MEAVHFLLRLGPGVLSNIVLIDGQKYLAGSKNSYDRKKTREGLASNQSERNQSPIAAWRYAQVFPRLVSRLLVFFLPRAAPGGYVLPCALIG